MSVLGAKTNGLGLMNVVIKKFVLDDDGTCAIRLIGEEMNSLVD